MPALVAALSTLVLVEALLQLGALIVFYGSERPTIEVGAATDTILCVGDSWTHGMGSSDSTRHSYPAVLQELLRQRTGKPWTVVNGGQSGQNSRDVLLRLPLQLERSRPRWVLVLVGRNDSWSRPQLVADDTEWEDYEAYRFRWRLPRLIAWMTGALRGETPATTPDPEMSRGPEWEPRQMPWPVGYPSEKSLAPPVAEAQVHAREGWRLMAGNQAELAIAAFAAARDLAPLDPQVRQALVASLARCGRTTDALEELSWLREQWSATGNYFVGLSFIRGLDAVNAHDEVKSIAAAFLENWPEDPVVRAQLAFALFQLGELDAAYEAVLRAQETFKHQYTYMIRRKIEEFTHRQREAIRTCFECYELTNDAKWLEQALNGRLEVDRQLAATMREELAARTCADDVRARMAEILEISVAASDGKAQESVLRAHWSRIVGQCARLGATPVFLTYPVSTAYGRQTIDFARDHDLFAIDVEATFAARVGPERLQTMRSSDGHVNDEGYRLMAEFVADGLLRLPGEWR